MTEVESDSGFMATHEKRHQNYAKFYVEAVKNNNKSREAGRDIFDDKVFILILCPGQMKGETRRPMQDKDKVEYAQAWADFQNGNKEPTVSGTPIEYLGIAPSRAKELRAVHIYTVEQMADCPDTAIKSVGMDFNTLKARAAALLSKSTPELEQLRRQAAEQAEQIAALTAQLAELTKPKKKPGRPPKAEMQAAA